MSRFYIEDENGTRSFFLRGIVIILIAILFFFVGSLFSLGTLSVIYKTTPLELLKGNEKARTGFHRYSIIVSELLTSRKMNLR